MLQAHGQEPQVKLPILDHRPGDVDLALVTGSSLGLPRTPVYDQPVRMRVSAELLEKGHPVVRDDVRDEGDAITPPRT